MGILLHSPPPPPPPSSQGASFLPHHEQFLSALPELVLRGEKTHEEHSITAIKDPQWPIHLQADFEVGIKGEAGADALMFVCHIVVQCHVHHMHVYVQRHVHHIHPPPPPPPYTRMGARCFDLLPRGGPATGSWSPT